MTCYEIFMQNIDSFPEISKMIRLKLPETYLGGTNIYDLCSDNWIEILKYIHDESELYNIYMTCKEFKHCVRC